MLGMLLRMLLTTLISIVVVFYGLPILFAAMVFLLKAFFLGGDGAPCTDVHTPSRAESRWGELDFDDRSRWEKGPDSITSKDTGVVFTRDHFGNWTASDDNGRGISDYYGWYEIED